MRCTAAVVLLLTSAPLLAQERLLQPEDLPARRTAAAVLAFGLDGWRQLDPAAGGERLLAAVRTARLCLPEGSAARQEADLLAARTEADAALAREAAALADDLDFRPVAEAELPDGVVGFQALDELELRSYPAYRMVRTDMKAGSIGAFWPLFQHIKARAIPMTTPVQVDLRSDGERVRGASMAFLYGRPELGPLGRDGRVEVVDVPPMTVLTVGARGYDRPARLAELGARLRSWLAAHPEWTIAGELRTMGYNSPSVIDERRYFEVQIPVRPHEPVLPPRGSV
jgi:hypothetical protein